MSKMRELVRLSRILVERDGQRLWKAQNSPAIISITFPADKLWIKKSGLRFSIFMAFPGRANARTCVYSEQPDDDTVIGEWGPWLEPYLTELRQRLPLEALSDV